MHIEPGIVDGAKIALSYVTAAGAGAAALKMCRDALRRPRGVAGLALRGALATGIAITCFQILPHYPVGVSEVHLILGAVLFLMLGAGATAIGLAGGLLVQGLFFAPADLPQYAMNVTTLLVPLWALDVLVARRAGFNRPFTSLSLGQVAAVSAVYQGGIVAWVAFWALYGEGVTLTNLSALASFGAAYLPVIALESLIGIAVLALARQGAALLPANLLNSRLLQAG